MNRSISFRLVALSLLSVIAAAAGASCEAPSVGDTCSPSCASPSTCETVCPCGNASCQTYACVVPDEAGVAYVLLDGGSAGNCSAP